MKAFALISKRQIWKKRGTWLRASFCILLGLITFWISTHFSYDNRFKIRGAANPAQDIILLQISSNEWITWSNNSNLKLSSYFKNDNLSDSFYWNDQLWEQLLSKLLKHSPKAIGVTFNFSNLENPENKSASEEKVFNHKKIYWSVSLDNGKSILRPYFIQSSNENIGIDQLTPENDGVLRQLSLNADEPEHFAFKVSQAKYYRKNKLNNLINYQGPKNSYKIITLTDLLSGAIEKKDIQNKTVIIGSSNSRSHQLQTPIGSMTKSEVIANIVTNQKLDAWIKSIPFAGATVIHLAILVLCLLIFATYPQSAVLVFYFWLSITYSAISIWLFDTYNLWTPIMSIVAQVCITYVIFLSYRLTVKDYEHWQFEQEQKYLLEIEQLKNNFVSLFSHDLKTPIAKIQAICDRMMRENHEQKLSDDLSNLRGISSELHRYIQSILQITKVESRDFKLNFDSFDINELIKESIDSLNALARTKNIEIQTHLEPMFLIEIDGSLVREVILNLIENAIKYSPEGSIIEISSKEAGEKVFLRVKDNGPGISEEDQVKIFDKFYRGKGEEHRSKGSGLGLYLVKYFIELHGGKVYLESSANKGTEVGFSLPI